MDNNTPPRTFLGDKVIMLPEYFRSQGYFTARVGKIAHSPFENALKWDISENATGRQRFADSDPTPSAVEKEGILGGAAVHFHATSNPDADEPDGHTARRIVEILEQNKDKPFFIAVGFHKPHEPLVCPQKYFELYPLDKIELHK